MAWPTLFTNGQVITHTALNSIISALSAWGGSVNAGGYNLSNVGSFAAAAISVATPSGSSPVVSVATAGGTDNADLELVTTGQRIWRMQANRGSDRLIIGDATTGFFLQMYGGTGKVAFPSFVGIDTQPVAKLHVHGDYSNTGAGGILLDATDDGNPEKYNLRINPYLIGSGAIGYQFQTKSLTGGTKVPLAFDNVGGVTMGGAVNATGLNSYASNAAAISGGLTTGAIYVVSGTTPAQLAIVT